MQRATRRQLVGTGLVTATALLAAIVLSPATVLAKLSALSTNPAAFLAVVFALYLLRPVLMWPISLLSMVVGYGLGIEFGLPVAFAGALVTNLPPFLIARYVRTDAGVLGLAARAGESVVEVTGAFRSIAAARLAPSQPDVVSYGAGLSGVSVGTYIVATLVGEIPWIVAAVLAGDSMRTLSTQGLDHSLSLVVGASALAVLLLAGPVYRRFDADAPLRGR
jgi:uncharacterized membrane protein YdjX (TVP38/TMEM64 family)